MSVLLWNRMIVADCLIHYSSPNKPSDWLLLFYCQDKDNEEKR